MGRLLEIRRRNQETYGFRTSWSEAERDRADLLDAVLWLVPYVRHADTCARAKDDDLLCTCQLTSVLSKVGL